MNNNIIKLGRCALIVLLSGLTILATAQVKTNKKIVSVKTNSSEPTTTTQNADFQGPIGIVPTYEFVIEDDIMQSKDGENGEGGTKNDDGNVGINSNSETNDIKSANFTTSVLNQLAQEIKVYPIPSNTFTNIDLGEISVKGLDIINSVGQRVHNQIVNQQLFRIDVSNYPAGLYFIQLRTDANQVVTKRIMITK